MRVFIAIPLPVDLKAKLVALQQEFRPLPLEAAWVREAGFHLTLKFLGDVDSTQIRPIVSCMTATVQHCHPFSLSLAGVGVFPHESSPRVLWVGVQDVTGDLRHMQQGPRRAIDAGWLSIRKSPVRSPSDLGSIEAHPPPRRFPRDTEAPS